MKISKENAYFIIGEASNIIKEIYPEFLLPTIDYIKITNAKSYWANIGKTSTYGYGIHISKYLFNSIKNKSLLKDRFFGCIIHELIHTIPGCNNHKSKFKSICKQINKNYPQYILQGNDKRIPLLFLSPPKYIMKCSVCNYEYYYFRKPKYPQEKYFCNKCGENQLKLYNNDISTYFSK